MADDIEQTNQSTDQPGNQDAPPSVDQSAPETTDAGYNNLLSSLTEDDAPADPASGQNDQAEGHPSGQPRDANGRFVSPSTDPSANPDAPAAEEQPAQPQSPEQEDAELLAGIQSDRGRARVQQIIEARRQAEGSVSAIREMVSEAGMTPETFGQHIEFARLLNSGNPRDLETAAQMIEDVRTDVYRRLGRDGPALDVLSAYPDLAQRVQSMEMPRETALEVARMRRQAEDADSQRQQQIAQQQQTRQFQQDIVAAQQSLEAYVETRKHEVDHPARMQAVSDYFANPANLQQFASTYQPHQWPAAIRMLYDNVRVAQAKPSQAPISSRPASTGRPALPADASSEDQIMRSIENMGLV